MASENKSANLSIEDLRAKYDRLLSNVLGRVKTVHFENNPFKNQYKQTNFKKPSELDKDSLEYAIKGFEEFLKHVPEGANYSARGISKNYSGAFKTGSFWIPREGIKRKPSQIESSAAPAAAAAAAVPNTPPSPVHRGIQPLLTFLESIGFTPAQLDMIESVLIDHPDLPPFFPSKLAPLIVKVILPQAHVKPTPDQKEAIEIEYAPDVENVTSSPVPGQPATPSPVVNPAQPLLIGNITRTPILTPISPFNVEPNARYVPFVETLTPPPGLVQPATPSPVVNPAQPLLIGNITRTPILTPISPFNVEPNARYVPFVETLTPPPGLVQPATPSPVVNPAQPLLLGNIERPLLLQNRPRQPTPILTPQGFTHSPLLVEPIPPPPGPPKSRRANQGPPKSRRANQGPPPKNTTRKIGVVGRIGLALATAAALLTGRANAPKVPGPTNQQLMRQNRFRQRTSGALVPVGAVTNKSRTFFEQAYPPYSTAGPVARYDPNAWMRADYLQSGMPPTSTAVATTQCSAENIYNGTCTELSETGYARNPEFNSRAEAAAAAAAAAAAEAEGEAGAGAEAHNLPVVTDEDGNEYFIDKYGQQFPIAKLADYLKTEESRKQWEELEKYLGPALLLAELYLAPGASIPQKVAHVAQQQLGQGAPARVFGRAGRGEISRIVGITGKGGGTRKLRKNKKQRKSKSYKKLIRRSK